ncbi:unnamed protein product [Hydatigera taeniaeformis]|uniref:LAM_G_DOMAIN domain-containing protein n=1 Tax=Hydatigena taeniaeformis TaxID=6205 RepID=A0A0R3WVI3_HYDTA|nr:unnamed protein product [Hydatigera taeniaeformis]
MKYTPEVVSLMDSNCTIGLKLGRGTELKISSEILMHPGFQELSKLVKDCNCRIGMDGPRVLIDSLANDEFLAFQLRVQSSSFIIEHNDLYDGKHYFVVLNSQEPFPVRE